MIDILLTITCSSLISLILKYHDTRRGESIVLLMGNYLTATLVSLSFYLFTESSSHSNPTFIFGLVLGLFFLLSFFAFARAVGSAGTALATVSARLSLIIPVFLSVVIYKESPGTWQQAGLALTLSTIILFYFSVKTDTVRKFTWSKYFYLIAVLVGIGLNDFGLKVFNQARPLADKYFFLSCIFGSALLYSYLFIRIKKTRIRKEDLITGLLLGVPNIFSSYFLLNALQKVPAVVVFPAVNTGIILVTAVLAFIIFKEKINTMTMFALITGMVAVACLSF